MRLRNNFPEGRYHSIILVYVKCVGDVIWCKLSRISSIAITHHVIRLLHMHEI